MRSCLSCKGLVSVVAAAAVAGCVSTQDRFDKGLELEQQGRYAEAADAYIKVLEKEPEWEDARARLQIVGAHAVDEYMADARAAAGASDFERAVELVARVDGLRARARGVRVTLSVPEDFADFRAQMRRRALASLTQQGERHAEAGRWAEALDAYSRALNYTNSVEKRSELNDARGRVYLGWAEYEISQGHFRGAIARTEDLIALLGPRHPLSDQAMYLQREAIAAGTQFVAFVPIGLTREARRAAPRGLNRDLSRALMADHWSEPPLFIAAIDPAAVQHEVADRGLEGEVVGRAAAARIGRALEADFVVAGELIGYARVEDVGSSERRSARVGVKGGVASLDTVYVVEEFDLKLHADVEYRIVDPLSRQLIDYGSLGAEVSDRFTRATFQGNYEDLRLTARERELFNEDDLRDAERELEDELLHELALSIAQHVYEQLLLQIP